MPGTETPKPPVFISHSAKDAAAREVLEKLCAALDADYEVLVDRERLKPNDDWREELHIWMKLCRGAVVLLSEDAVCRSPWVKREATVLGYRREDEGEKFKLIPVLLGGVTSQHLRQGDFAPLALPAIQAIRNLPPDEIVTEVLKALAPLRTSEMTPLQEFEETLAGILFDQLEAGGKDPQPLFAAAAAAGLRLEWRAGKSYSRQLARGLLEAGLEKSVPAVSFLARHFRDKAQLVRLLDLLKPFWVPPDAVSELPRMNKRPRGQRAVCVNGVEYPFTAQCYILRARGSPRQWVWANAIPKKGHEEVGLAHLKSIESSIKKEVAFQLGFDEGEEDEQGLDDYLEDLEGRGEPFFIIVPEKFDEELLRLLRARFQSFTFFMLHGSQAPDERELEGKHIVFLKPELAPGQDERFHRLYRTALGDIRRTV